MSPDEAVLKQAEEIDRRIGNGEEVGPLAGVLVAVKDNICTADMPSTAGSRILKNYRPPYDATCVKKLRENGAIIVGKTNLDEFGMGSTTEGSAYQVRILTFFFCFMEKLLEFGFILKWNLWLKLEFVLAVSRKVWIFIQFDCNICI